MRNIRMIVSYDGTKYYGFQTQPIGNTIQDIIEHGLKILTGEEISITASGRTDAGVHARGQVINFITRSPIPIERWALALNSRLPKDIAVLTADEVPLNFHSSHFAKRKTYRYSIDTNKFADVFERHYRYHYPMPLLVSAMEEALSKVVGEHDFTSFASQRSTKPTHVRTILRASLEQSKGKIDILVTGNGFLYNMVRIIVGTLLWVGEGKLDVEDFERILKAKDRSAAGPTAMSHGLTLMEVEYDF
ncbi:tRNA pseudouridine synthase A [Paenibacillus baekrokdamisoli]|uniref:tRNA pseudouridine synthase A n=1 Tax=Paenibacillus baekrokdamisoli TaxID=1712516 RepID=A0A3G9IZN6_9BACL|nr:tRNA pseudouridine(38-40) synthase TruA [Paenibacillus baekrokdamisoli]MBB3073093.1 tRNA pseudouridine38-40 synthase [Paenibacillus baekrokdamisoli]BBH24026.1 tRNA pseudouridine synthase A [Paenibacillus baekrokdamisoli]